APGRHRRSTLPRAVGDGERELVPGDGPAVIPGKWRVGNSEERLFAVRYWLFADIGHVPTRSGALSLRKAAITDSAVILPVLGFSDGIFSIASEKRAESASTSILWQLRVTEGSAQISIVVRSGPMPASDSA